MATRSAIGYVTESGTIMAAYCHWDGYLSHNGQILNSHYTDENKIVELILGGEMSSLGSEIGVKHPFDKYDLSDEEKAKFENMTTYYGRDRGEIDTDHKVFKSIEEFVEYYDGIGVEYFYLYNEGKWLVSQYGKDFESLTEALERELSQDAV
jgi:hypothetical protein